MKVGREVAERMRRGSAVSLLLSALFLRMMVPAGWMPAEGFALQLCPSGGAPATAVAHHTSQQHGAKAHGVHHAAPEQEAPAKHEQGKQPCAFSGLGSALDTPAVPSFALAPNPLAERLLATRPEAPAIGRGLAAPPPPSTGPPLLL